MQSGGYTPEKEGLRHKQLRPGAACAKGWLILDGGGTSSETTGKAQVSVLPG